MSGVWIDHEIETARSPPRVAFARRSAFDASTVQDSRGLLGVEDWYHPGGRRKDYSAADSRASEERRKNSRSLAKMAEEARVRVPVHGAR